MEAVRTDRVDQVCQISETSGSKLTESPPTVKNCKFWLLVVQTRILHSKKFASSAISSASRDRTSDQISLNCSIVKRLRLNIFAVIHKGVCQFRQRSTVERKGKTKDQDMIFVASYRGTAATWGWATQNILCTK
jgi:hypothetical protein